MHEERDEVRVREGQRRVEDHRDAVDGGPGLDAARVQARGERWHEHLALCFFELEVRTDVF